MPYMYTVFAEIQFAGVFLKYLTFSPKNYRFSYSFDSAIYKLDLAF